jgi:hypothetical protein
MGISDGKGSGLLKHQVGNPMGANKSGKKKPYAGGDSNPNSPVRTRIEQIRGINLKHLRKS